MYLKFRSKYRKLLWKELNAYKKRSIYIQLPPYVEDRALAPVARARGSLSAGAGSSPRLNLRPSPGLYPQNKFASAHGPQGEATRLSLAKLESS
jgi:hypothetical protein